jgi:hypothetical protein
MADPTNTPTGNSVVQWWKSQNPSDTRPDDVITLDLATKYPDTFNTYPDAVSDYQRIVQDTNKSALTTSDYITQPFKSFAGSAIRGVADIPETIAAASKSTGLTTGNLQDSLLYQSGQAMENIAPGVTPGLEDSWVANKMPSSLGSFIPYLVGGGLGRAIMRGGVEAIARSAAESALKDALASGATDELAQSAAVKAAGKAKDGYLAQMLNNAPIAALGASQSAIGAYKEALSKGADEATALGPVFWWNALAGTAMAIPVAPWLDRMNKASGGELGKTLIQRGMEISKEGATTALFSTITQFADNYVAKIRTGIY